MFHVNESYRITKEKAAEAMPIIKKNLLPLLSDYSHKNNGAFIVPYKGIKYFFLCLASDGMGWEHISVSIFPIKRCPTWEEMCFIKNKFWDESDMVIQIHPEKGDYINNHEFCLHLWRPTNQVIPKPDKTMVGI